MLADLSDNPAPFYPIFEMLNEKSIKFCQQVFTQARDIQVDIDQLRYISKSGVDSAESESLT
jgi:hypothetical protein